MLAPPCCCPSSFPHPGMGLPLLLLLLLTGGGAPTEGALCGIAASGLGGLSPAQEARPAGVVKNCVSSAPDLQVAPYEARAYRVGCGVRANAAAAGGGFDCADWCGGNSNNAQGLATLSQSTERLCVYLNPLLLESKTELEWIGLGSNSFNEYGLSPAYFDSSYGFGTVTAGQAPAAVLSNCLAGCEKAIDLTPNPTSNPSSNPTIPTATPTSGPTGNPTTSSPSTANPTPNPTTTLALRREAGAGAGAGAVAGGVVGGLALVSAVGVGVFMCLKRKKNGAAAAAAAAQPRSGSMQGALTREAGRGGGGSHLFSGGNSRSRRDSKHKDAGRRFSGGNKILPGFGDGGPGSSHPPLGPLPPLPDI